MIDVEIYQGELHSISKHDLVHGTLTIPDNVKYIKSLNVQLGTNVEIRHIIIPNSVEVIGAGSLSNLRKLETVEIEDGLKEIGANAFAGCINLRYIDFPSSLTSIQSDAFLSCENLKNITLPKNIRFIGPGAFTRCKKLTRVSFNKDMPLIKIEDDLFRACEDLSVVNLPESLEVIGKDAFFGCSSLKFITLPDNLIEIESQAFRESGLVALELPDKVKRLGRYAFYQAENLTSVELSEDLKVIPSFCFRECKKLKNVVMKDGVTQIEDDAFKSCVSLQKIQFSKSLKEIGSYAFSDTELKSINLPNSLEKIKKSAFNIMSLESVKFGKGLRYIGEGAFENSDISEVNLPNSLEYIGASAFYATNISEISIPKSVKEIATTAFPRTLERLTVYHDVKMSSQDINDFNIVIKNRFTGEIIIKRICEVDVDGNGIVEIMRTNENSIQLSQLKRHSDRKIMFFDLNNKWVELNMTDINELRNYDPDMSCRKTHEWSKVKKFKPAHVIMKNIPIGEIENFYINKNNKKWGELLKLSKLKSQEEMGAFFKLCYSLGLFSKMGKDSDKAYSFIKNQILKKERRGKYHIRFEEMDIENNGFDKDFATLVYLHYPKSKKRKFLVSDDEFGESKDYFASVYNNFKTIKEAYKNKVINTNTIREMLTPEMCILATSLQQYDNVIPGNEVFAKNIGLYGYSQDVFDNAQKLFEIGKSISNDNLTLHIKDDDQSKTITYELLEKDNPQGVILGNITNCCQTLEGAAKSCVEYGLSERNSKFMVFKSKDKVIGQSWVWYDETTKKICLDNIEIPDAISKNKVKFLLLKGEMIACLKRMNKNFLSAMEEKGLEVDSVTIGSGYNDMGGFLGANFKKSSEEPKLTGYNGYSDASTQYILYKRK